MSEAICGVYIIKNTRNGKKYIGSTNDFTRRKREHVGDLKRNKHHCDYLQRAWNAEEDTNVFIFSLFLHCPESFLEELEQKCIDNMHPEYNSSRIVGRIEMTESVCEKISSALIGRPLSAEHREKLRLAKLGKPSPLKGRASPLKGRKGKPSPNKGKPQSEEAKAKFRATWEAKRIQANI